VVITLLFVAGAARYRGPDRRGTTGPPARPLRLLAAIAGIGLLAVTGGVSGPAGPGTAVALTWAASLWFLAGAVRVLRRRVVGDARSLRLAVVCVAAGLAGLAAVSAEATGSQPALLDVAGAVAAAAAVTALAGALATPEIDSRLWPAVTVGTPVAVGVVVGTVAGGVPALAPVALAAVTGLMGGLGAAAVVVGARARAGALAWAGVGVLGAAAAAVGGPGPLVLGGLAVLGSALVDLAGPYRALRTRTLAVRVEAEAARADLAARQADWAERAHDTRSALLAVQGATRALTRRADTLRVEERDRLAAAIDAELDRVRALVGGAGDDRAAPVRLAEVVAPVVACRREAGQRIEVAVPAELSVLARPSALREVVANLLDNAGRHAPGTPVTLTAVATAADVRLVVADRGPGVAPEAREAIFERGVTSRPDIGSGLGLHVARRLARAGGGDLWVQDAEGGGAAFVLALPPASGGRVAPRGVDGAEQLERPHEMADLGALQLDHAVPAPGGGAHP
jgi:signal transduction histidine kinase